jgi:hypothetical protein
MVIAMRTDEIKAALREACRILERTPFPKGSRPAQLRAGWPDVVREAADAYGYTATRNRPALPSPLELDRMDEALRWLLWVEGTERTVLFARACGVTWRALQEKLDTSYPTLAKIHGRGLTLIAARLEKKS